MPLLGTTLPEITSTSVVPERVPAEPFAVGTLVDGKYRIERRIAEGGIGIVLEARHVALNQLVAIKYLKPKARADRNIVERFEREARLTALMKSEHVVRVHDVGSTPDGGPYIVMEHLTGRDLGTVVQEGCVPVARAVDWVLQACDALAEAHAMDVVHRDIKPENIFLAEHPGTAAIVKVIDFGVSKMPPHQDARGNWARETGTNECIGTPYYMSPEQLQSSVDVDARSDIWSLGAVLFELVSAKTPFVGDDFARLCTAILCGEPRLLREVCPSAPEGLELVISRCLEKDPALRFRNVAELAQELLPFGLPESARYRVERVRDAVTRSGRSIRPPTPSSAMLVQRLALDPTPLTMETLLSSRPSRAVQPRSRMLPVAGLIVGALVAASVVTLLRRDPAPPAPIVVQMPPPEVTQAPAPLPSARVEPVPASASASALAVPVVRAKLVQKIAPTPSVSVSSREIQLTR